MNEEAEHSTWLTEALALDDSALDTDEDDLSGVPEQANSEESPEPVDNGAPGVDTSDSSTDPQPVSPVRAGKNIPSPAQFVSDQEVAGVGSVDGSQVAMGAP